MGHPKEASPGAQSKGFAIERNEPRGAGVLHLLVLGGPAAIARFVIAVLIWIAIQ